MQKAVQLEIERLINLLKAEQTSDGSWNYAFDTGVITDAYMIILLRSLSINNEEKLIIELTERIMSKQEQNGAWKLYYDEEQGNLSRTIEAYYGLLYSGYYDKDDECMQKAQTFILARGGLEKAGMFTKIMLCLTGQLPWPVFFPVPIEVMLLPAYFPVHLFDISVFGRANIVPILLLGNRKHVFTTKDTPELSHLKTQKREQEVFVHPQLDEWQEYFSSLIQARGEELRFFEGLEQQAINDAEQYMLRRIEPDGTLLSYFSSTFLMIFALLSIGYSENDPLIERALDGLKSMKCKINGCSHVQYTTADVWNTSLISYALQEAGAAPADETIRKANAYLLSRQNVKYGDWAIHNPHQLPGGFGFSNINTINPDVDDSTASLRSLAHEVFQEPGTYSRWQLGSSWVLSMQNDDGGWPSFEKGINKPYLSLLPIEKAAFIFEDPSSADLTGRTLEFLGNYTNLSKQHPSVKKAHKWLKSNQEANGSWYGRWGICYIYGTWAAVTGLAATGAAPGGKLLKKAVSWLEEIQRIDGGWGESCESDQKKKYVPLQASTLTHTAWAVDALISVSETPTKAIEKGIQFLVKHGKSQKWTEDYPKGQGMGGTFYIHYHSYRFIWPLLTLSHYTRKYS
ncbi:squalene--hopene cyclase [Halobacillus salinarum]|uniref:Squalene--hopene cyclase n=1 Tax=Halobacillus salinarum TaxID=2932257 RepID=A0ABY4EHI2_9BACI|nr:prenyltransferase/squalene oxidase repeat-containing protein [Halobacillus salinarum]UOQ43094.1 squalene--hopene cyclase [Halobacillus salinarum]